MQLRARTSIQFRRWSLGMGAFGVSLALILSPVLISLMPLTAPIGLESAWAARSDQEIQREIEAVLAERHPSDSPEWWRSLGPNTPRVILKMLDDSERIYHRVRLTQALGWFDDPEALEYLKTQARESNEDVVRNAAIRSVGNSQGAKELEFISGFLQHADPQTRLSAAETLQKLDDPGARERLQKFMAEEKAGWVVAKLKGELPKPTGMLTPVASSEDRLSSDWEGGWTGYWLVASGPTPKSAVDPVAITLDLKVKDATELSGELRTKKYRKWPERSFSLRKFLGKKLRAEGTLEQRSAGKAPASVAVEVELVKISGQTAIELRSPGSAILGLLVRETLESQKPAPSPSAKR